MDIGGSKMNAAQSRVNAIQSQIDQTVGQITKATVGVKTSERYNILYASCIIWQFSNKTTESSRNEVTYFSHFWSVVCI